MNIITTKSPKKYLARFVRGKGAMYMSFIDYFEHEGYIIKERHSMGGADQEYVDKVPTEIKGYIKNTNKN